MTRPDEAPGSAAPTAESPFGSRGVLDHGYIRLVESWGSDEDIVATARMSTGKGFKGWDTDARLLRRLYKDRHSSPFEFAGATFEVQAPIMVFREWHRHRTQSYSERSARYAPLPEVNYLPTVERLLMARDPNNAQAGVLKDAPELTAEVAFEWLAELEAVYEHAERVYASGLAKGVPKELARLPIPVGRYTTMRATGNLRNWLAFATLRSASDAQWEIRQYSNSVLGLLQERFPRTLELFAEFNRGP